MKSISVTIVEEELLIAESIRIFLTERGHTVSDICISYEEALKSLNTSPPDIFLLDIRLYGVRSGIDIASYLAEHSDIPYIFLTSQYDEVVLKQAIATTPYGYLTKPFRKETLWTTIESAYQLSSSKKVAEHKISVFDGRNNHRVNTDNIIYIKADHVYIELFLNNSQNILARNTLSDFYVELDNSVFIMPHRSFIVNKNYINSWDQSNIYLSNITIPISRSRRKEIIERLS